MIEIEEIPMKRPKLIIFEGCDKVGKSTLFQAVRRATKYGPLAVDRFTGSNYVYDKHYGRETDLDMYIQTELDIQDVFDCYLILLTGDLSIIKGRIAEKEQGIDLEIALDNFHEINDLFVDYFHNQTEYKHKLWLDTTSLCVNDCVEEIMKFIKED